MYKRAFVHVHDTNAGDDVSFRYYVWQLGYGLFPVDRARRRRALAFWLRDGDEAARSERRGALALRALVRVRVLDVHALAHEVPPLHPALRSADRDADGHPARSRAPDAADHGRRMRRLARVRRRDRRCGAAPHVRALRLLGGSPFGSVPAPATRPGSARLVSSRGVGLFVFAVRRSPLTEPERLEPLESTLLVCVGARRRGRARARRRATSFRRTTPKGRPPDAPHELQLQAALARHARFRHVIAATTLRVCARLGAALRWSGCGRTPSRSCSPSACGRPPGRSTCIWCARLRTGASAKRFSNTTSGAARRGAAGRLPDELEGRKLLHRQSHPRVRLDGRRVQELARRAARERRARALLHDRTLARIGPENRARQGQALRTAHDARRSTTSSF